MLKKRETVIHFRIAFSCFVVVVVVVVLFFVCFFQVKMAELEKFKADFELLVVSKR